MGTLFHQAPLLAGPACYGQFSRLGSPKLVAPKPRKEAQPGIEKKNKVPIPQVTFINDLEPPIYIPLSYIYYLTKGINGPIIRTQKRRKNQKSRYPPNTTWWSKRGTVRRHTLRHHVWWGLQLLVMFVRKVISLDFLILRFLT